MNNPTTRYLPEVGVLFQEVGALRDRLTQGLEELAADILAEGLGLIYEREALVFALEIVERAWERWDSRFEDHALEEIFEDRVLEGAARDSWANREVSWPASRERRRRARDPYSLAGLE